MFSIKVRARFGDIDALGHINNTVMACWFELARNPIMQIFDPDLELNKKSKQKKFPAYHGAHRL